MPLPIGCWTVPGRRRTNQDAAVSASLGGDAEVAAVADGMGGHAAGEIASQEALHALVSALRGGADLREAVRAANRVVYKKASESPALHGMGTTLVVYLRRGAQYEIANVGDSRAYLVEGGKLTRLTRDHSFVVEAVASGTLTEEDAQHSVWRNALTRAIGTDPEVEADFFGPFDANRPQHVVLCSDGFHRWIPEAEIAAGVAAVADPGGAAAMLGQSALRAGSDDNVTVMIIELGSGRSRVPTTSAPTRAGAIAHPPVTPGLLSQLALQSAQTPRWRVRADPARKIWWRWRRLDLFYFILLFAILLAALTSLALLAR